MNSPWIRAQDRRRSLIATASTVCIYALAFGGAYLVGILAPATLASVPSTIIVDLGGLVGPPGEIPQGLETAPDRPPDAPLGAAPLPAAANPAPPAPEAPNAPASSVAAIPESVPAEKAQAKVAPPKAVPKPTPKTLPKAVVKSAPPPAKTIPVKDAAAVAAEEAEAKAAADAQAAKAAQDEAVQRAVAATAKAAAGPAKTRTFGSGAASGSAPVSGTGTGSAPGVAGGTGSVTFRGGEKGSALTTTFGASSGQVGRTLYEPIWMFMPLPKMVGDSVYRNISAKETFRSFYNISGSDWKLKSQPRIAERDGFWFTLVEAAGYDASTADYKKGRKLQPVILEFAVGPLTKKKDLSKAELVDVRLVSSSGFPEIDEAVIYGFRQSAFFNKTGYAVSGKFVYGF